ncbi:hypothetical protein [Streptomyces blattellae]|uniref:hypothetical protein n=1 Tax=Streptomyces blattellae TaxID=2569855 RepID=UPI0012B813CE|nr:hypothetical protein [Streptomyces blattellae]
MRRPNGADRLIRDGEPARDAGEQERLRSIDIELQSLLPEPSPQPARPGEHGAGHLRLRVGGVASCLFRRGVEDASGAMGSMSLR